MTRVRRVRSARRGLLGLLGLVGLLGLLVGCADGTAGEITGTVSTSAASSTTAASTTTTTTTIPASTTVSTSAGTTAATSTGLPGAATRYVVPVAGAGASWGDTHSSYPATDVFVVGGCGGSVVSPVTGAALEVRRIDSWDPAVDDPATRGGRSVAILGDDGVRYYLAHFETIDAAIEPGVRVEAGQPLGVVGDTGRTSACHIHFGISPPCPDAEWSIRRGVIWPFPYLDAWRAGEQANPAEEVAAWSAANPDACAAAAGPARVSR